MSQEQQPIGGSLSGEGSPCPEVTLNGKTYRIGWNTQKAKHTLEQLVAWSAAGSIEEMHGVIPAVKVAAMELRVLDHIRSRQHWTFGELWHDVMNGPLSPILFVASLLREHQPAASFEELTTLARDLVSENSLQLRVALSQIARPFATTLVRDAPFSPEQREQRASMFVMLVEATFRITAQADESPTPSTSATVKSDT